MPIAIAGVLGSGWVKDKVNLSAQVTTTSVALNAGEVALVIAHSEASATPSGTGLVAASACISKDGNDHSGLSIGGFAAIKCGQELVYYPSGTSTPSFGMILSMWALWTQFGIASGAAVVQAMGSLPASNSVGTRCVQLIRATVSTGKRLTIRSIASNDQLARVRENLEGGNWNIGAPGAVEHVAIHGYALNSGNLLTPTYASGWTPLTLVQSSGGSNNRSLLGECKAETTTPSVSNIGSGTGIASRAELGSYLIEENAPVVVVSGGPRMML